MTDQRITAAEIVRDYLDQLTDEDRDLLNEQYGRHAIARDLAAHHEADELAPEIERLLRQVTPL